jgi:hypothetical protein
MAAGWGDHIATPAAPVDMRQTLRVDVAQPGRGQVEMPAATAGADERPRAVQAMLGGQGSNGLFAAGAVDVQDVEGVAGGQADVGLGMAGPPGQHPGPVGGGVLDAVGNQAAPGVLANLAAARIPTRATSPHDRLLVAGNRLDVAAEGEGLCSGSTGMPREA